MQVGDELRAIKINITDLQPSAALESTQKQKITQVTVALSLGGGGPTVIFGRKSNFNQVLYWPAL
jgi:hypothetical protein